MIIENSSGINECLEELGKRINEIRIASCMTQEDLSQKAGISLSSVGRIEKGQSVQLDNLLSVLKALNLLSKLEVALPAERISPMQQLEGTKKKKIYRKTRSDKTQKWEWGE